MSEKLLFMILRVVTVLLYRQLCNDDIGVSKQKALLSRAQTMLLDEPKQ